MCRKLKTVHTWHFDIQQHYIRDIFLQLGNCIDTVFRRDNIHVMTLQQAGRHLSYGNRVINDHDRDALPFRRTAHQFLDLIHHATTGPDTAQHGNHIQNHDYTSVTQNGCAGHAPDSTDLRSDRLDNNFTTSKQVFHMESNAMIAGSCEQYRQSLLCAVEVRCAGTQHTTQVTHLVIVTTVFKTRLGIVIISLEILTAHTHDTLNARQRHCVGILANLYKQRLVQCQGKGQPHGESRTLTLPGVNVQ